MRIISGQFKGRVLSNFKGLHIRPTTDRVKETIFNKLQGQVEGVRVLDLFAGTGNLGLEALSRGAKEIVSVENHPQSLSVIKKNLELLKIIEGFTVVPKDVIEFCRSYKGFPFDLIFIDPPFTKKMADLVMKSVAQSQVFSKDSIIILESGGKEEIGNRYSSLIQTFCKKFGDKNLSFFESRDE